MTISASIGRRPANAPRAFIMSATEQRNNTTRQADEPIFTLKAGGDRMPRAWLVSANGTDVDVRPTHEPSMTVVANDKTMRPRAWLSSGRVVSMTPRALARFQSAPDSYVLPDKPGLACRIIGNACPPRLMESLYRGLLA